MKRRWIIGMVLAVLTGIGVYIFLNAEALVPARFTGIWYCSADGRPYIFENGVIISEDPDAIALEENSFSGAYSFARDRAALFLVRNKNAGEVLELRFRQTQYGDVLYERKDGKDVIRFYRNRMIAQNLFK